MVFNVFDGFHFIIKAYYLGSTDANKYMKKKLCHTLIGNAFEVCSNKRLLLLVSIDDFFVQFVVHLHETGPNV